MVNHTIQYKDTTYNITISNNSSICVYVESDGQKRGLDLVGHSVSKKLKQIVCNYNEVLLDGNDNPIKGVSYPQRQVKSPNYDKIYDIVVNGVEGDFADSGLMNLIMQEHTKDPNCLPFDITNGYAPQQPIIFAVNVDGFNAEAIVINKSQDKTVEYCVDDGNWSTNPVFEGIAVGNHVIKAKYTDGTCVFSVLFVIQNNKDVEEIV